MGRAFVCIAVLLLGLAAGQKPTEPSDLGYPSYVVLPWSKISISVSVFSRIGTLSENQLIEILRKDFKVRVIQLKELNEIAEPNPSLSLKRVSRDEPIAEYFEAVDLAGAVETLADGRSLRYLPRFMVHHDVATLWKDRPSPAAPVLLLGPAADRMTLLHAIGHHIYNRTKYPMPLLVRGQKLHRISANLLEVLRLKQEAKGLLTMARLNPPIEENRTYDLRELAYYQTVVEAKISQFETFKMMLWEEADIDYLLYTVRNEIGLTSNDIRLVLKHYWGTLLKLEHHLYSMDSDSEYSDLLRIQPAFGFSLQRKIERSALMIAKLRSDIAREKQWILTKAKISSPELLAELGIKLKNRVQARVATVHTKLKSKPSV